MISFTTLMKVSGIIAFFALTAAIIISCSKGGVPADNGNGGGHINNPADTVPPVVTILTPAENQIFANGSVIQITGRITDDEGLYRGSVWLTDDATGVVLKEQLYEIHGLRLYNYSVNHTAFVTAASDYTVTVRFEDHGYNSVTKSVKIKVNP